MADHQGLAIPFVSHARTYNVQIAAELAERFTEWTRVDSLGADWFKVELHDDGTAEVLLSAGEDHS